MTNRWICTQLATVKNDYGYSDYEMVVIDTPGMIIEMILTIPFDANESPYLRLVFGNQEERFDFDTPTHPITRAQAAALLGENVETQDQ